MIKRLFPSEKLKELKEILKDYEATVHTCGDEDEEYSYLKEGCYCITLKNASGYELFIDWDGEFTLTYDAWHAHYSHCASEYKSMLEDLTYILNGVYCAFSIFCNGQWRGSSLLENTVTSKDEARQHIKSYYDKKFIAQMKADGVEAHYVGWNESNIIKFEPGEL